MSSEVEHKAPETTTTQDNLQTSSNVSQHVTGLARLLCRFIGS